MRTATRDSRTVYIPDNAPDKYFYTAAKAQAYEKKYRSQAPEAPKAAPKTRATAVSAVASGAKSTIPRVMALWKPPTPRYVRFTAGGKQSVPEGEHPVFTSPGGQISLVWDVSDAEGNPISYQSDAIFVRKSGIYTFDALADPADSDELFTVELQAGMTTAAFLDAILRRLDAYPRSTPFPLSLFTDIRHPFRSSYGSLRIVWGGADPTWLQSLTPSPKRKSGKLRLDIGVESVQGPRNYQEDRVLVDGNLAVVADGMGGHEGGDRAAQAAVDTIKAEVRAGRPLLEAVRAADRAVTSLAHGSRYDAPGATVVAVLFDVEKGVATIVHSGDARCTIVDPSGAVWRSVDHNHAGNAFRSGRLGDEWIEPRYQSNLIGQALGHDCEPEETSVRLVRGQTFVLSSDGVHDVLVRDLEAIVGAHPKASALTIARRLVDAALPKTKDNATCAVIKIR